MPVLTRWVTTPAKSKTPLRSPCLQSIATARILQRPLWRPSAIRLSSSSSPTSTLPPKPTWRPGKSFTPPTEIEKGWYEYWDSRGCFEPFPDNRNQVRMLLPPPNVTGELHIGHALMVAIQDALARYYRMTGHSVKWAPGTDHAGIATQIVVERMLEQERGLTREDIGREKFEEVVEAWREKYGSRILEQIRRLGASTTNSREYYTRDVPRSTAVTNSFVKLWEEGLIYRHTRMANWCVKLQTAVSDIEVTTREINGPLKIDRVEYGIIHRFAFPLVDGSGEIEVSTTRPETIPGDRAIAVHPDDERYKHLHYKLARHPLLPDVTLPIIPDAELVDPEMGTGAVKITPAHDTNDYSFWLRHSKQSPLAAQDTETKRVDIPLVQIFGKRGKMKPTCGIPTLVGDDRLWTRRKIVTMLQQCQAYRGGDHHAMRLAVCERSGSVIEPMLVPQWYLRMKPLAEKVFEVAKRDGLKFVPEAPHSVLWERWLSGIQDWCLSRQIWWGHRVPAYMVINPYSETDDKVVRWLAAESDEAAERKLTLEEREKGYFLKQDTDVLDTWFSSGLLPLSTASWTGKSWSQKKKENYPLRFIESGGDILFFWLARMAMLCTWFTDKLPFNEIILHPLVCDAQGRKMSKSVGNVIDPLLVVNGRTHEQMVGDLQAEFKEKVRREGEAGLKAAAQLRARITDLRRMHPNGFKESGADSLRMALVDYTSRTVQINMEMQRVDYFRRLTIKMENAFKLYQQGHSIPWTMYDDFASIPRQYTALHDLHLINCLRKLTATVNTAFETRQLHQATTALRDFIWDDFCNCYLELVKPLITNAPTTPEEMHRRDTAMTVLALTWDHVLRLIHPFMPFISETFWQAILPNPRPEDEVIMLAPFPTVDKLPVIHEAALEDVHPMLRLIESLREYGAGKMGGVKLTHLELFVVIPHGTAGAYLMGMMERVKAMTKSKGVVAVPEQDMGAVAGPGEQWEVIWAEETRPGWTVWERPETGRRIMMWGLETPGTKGQMKTLMAMAEGMQKSAEPMA